MCSKRWIWEQYDYQVRTNTLAGPGSDAAIVRIKETGTSSRDVARRQRALLLSGSARRDEADGGRVLPQSVDVSGATAGRGHQQSELRQSGAAGDHGAAGGIDRGTWRGMHRSSRRRSRAATSSLYNETLGEGDLSHAGDGHRRAAEDRRRRSRITFTKSGPAIFLLGGFGKCDLTHFGGTQYAKEILDKLWGLPPQLDMDYEKRVQAAMREIARRTSWSRRTI